MLGTAQFLDAPMATVLNIQQDETGRFSRIAILEEGAVLAAAVTTAAELGSFAALALETAKTMSERSGAPLATGEQAYSVVLPSKIALGPCSVPNCEALVAVFGETAFGIAIPRNHLRQLGEALVALSATGTPT